MKTYLLNWFQVWSCALKSNRENGRRDTHNHKYIISTLPNRMTRLPSKTLDWQPYLSSVSLAATGFFNSEDMKVARLPRYTYSLRLHFKIPFKANITSLIIALSESVQSDSIVSLENAFCKRILVALS